MVAHGEFQIDGVNVRLREDVDQKVNSCVKAQDSCCSMQNVSASILLCDFFLMHVFCP